MGPRKLQTCQYHIDENTLLCQSIFCPGLPNEVNGAKFEYTQLNLTLYHVAFAPYKSNTQSLYSHITVLSLIWDAPNLNTEMLLISACSCLCAIYWSWVLSREWRWSWSSGDRRCSNYIWVINIFIAYWGVAYIRGFMVSPLCHWSLACVYLYQVLWRIIGLLCRIFLRSISFITEPTAPHELKVTP